jgi:hypothetical protein
MEIVVREYYSQHQPLQSRYARGWAVVVMPREHEETATLN